MVPMRKEELLERYEALGGERDFLAAQPLYAQAPDARLLDYYGYLPFAHAGGSCAARPSCTSERSRSTRVTTTS